MVLIGTVRTLRQADAMLRVLDLPPVVAGCVLITEAHTDQTSRPDQASPSAAIAPDDLPVVPIGALSDLPLLTVRLGLKAAVLCLPADHPARSLVRQHAARANLLFRELPTIAELLSAPPPSPQPTAAATTQSHTVTTTKTTTPHHAHPPTPSSSSSTWTPPASIDLAALINRTPHTLDRDAVAKVLTGKRVLITGAGGSIGSELARVAASFAPAQLILMERGENALFEIDRQLAQRFPSMPRKAVLHDVVDAEDTLKLLGELRPHTVFHAAAHKHVPLMEDHPAHAVTNNLFGTKSIADAAVFAGAERFVMISSDKAVNPTSVMGATKRMAEMYIQSLGYRHAPRGSASPLSPTRLSMVRFGNVLGSNASVLTIWSQQVAEGGPVTVTDPRMTRYFMTIPEAATLVMQSATLDAVGEAREGGVGVYVLDMGDPIAIAELAMRFIRLHGITPRVRGESSPASAELAQRLSPLLAGSLSGPTMDVVFTGARPGEKLHEELAYAAEALKPTTHPGIRAWAGAGFENDVAARADQMVAEMAAARMSPDRYQVLSMIRKHVPEMRPPTPASPQTITHPNVG